MYTSPLSTLISSLSLNHHLYADDTQLFLSFRPPDFDSSVTHLQNALQHISSLVTANLLTVISSKTEFLLIGLKQQLAKIHTTAHSIPLIQLGTLVSSSIDISLSLTKYLSLSLVIITFVNFAVSARLDFKTASTIATSIVHSKLDYCNSILQPSKMSNKSPSGYSELSCLSCG